MTGILLSIIISVAFLLKRPLTTPLSSPPIPAPSLRLYVQGPADSDMDLGGDSDDEPTAEASTPGSPRSAAAPTTAASTPATELPLRQGGATAEEEMDAGAGSPEAPPTEPLRSVAASPAAQVEDAEAEQAEAQQHSLDDADNDDVRGHFLRPPSSVPVAPQTGHDLLSHLLVQCV